MCGKFFDSHYLLLCLNRNQHLPVYNEGEGNMVEKVKFYIYFFFILIEHSCSKSI